MRLPNRWRSSGILYFARLCHLIFFAVPCEAGLNRVSDTRCLACDWPVEA